MKTCDKCGKIYDDNFEKCPYCNKQTLFNKFDKFEILITFLLISVIIFIFINWKLSILLLILFISLSLFFQIKYPNEANKRFNFTKVEDKKLEVVDLSKFEFFEVKHISGIEDLKFNEKCELYIANSQVDFHSSSDDFLSTFKFSELKKCIMYEEIEARYKDKAPVIRAITGGLLLGPIGAIAAGVSGIIPTVDETKSYFLEFQFKDEDIMENIIISANYEILEKIKIMVLK